MASMPASTARANGRRETDMFTMFRNVCPICGGDVVANQRKPGLYLCQACHVESDVKDLKQVPIDRSTKHADTNIQPNPGAIQESPEQV